MAKARAYISGFSLTALGGLMQSIGDLVATVETDAKKDEEFKLACPACADEDTVGLVGQNYACVANAAHGPYARGVLRRAKEVAKGSFVLLDDAAIEAAKESDLPNNTIDLVPYKRDEVAPFMAPTQYRYVFRDNGKGTLFPVLMQLMAARPDLVFVGKGAIKKSEKFVSVDRGLNGQLVITALEWPGDLRVFDTPDLPEVKPSLVEMATKLFEESIGTFDPAEYEKGARKKLSEAVAAAANGGAPVLQIVGEAASPTSTLDNLEALLRQSLEAKAS